MELQKLQKDYRHMNDYNSNTSKYHLNCNATNILDKIKHFDKFLVDNHKVLTEELFVITAFLRDNLVNNNLKPHIVIKMSSNHNIIQRDFDINEKIKDIEGFIKYDCIFKCYDNNRDKIIKEIKRNKNYDDYDIMISLRDDFNRNVNVKQLPVAGICQGNSTDGQLYNVIIMPYIKSKTLGEKKWKDTEDDKLKLRSLYKQIIMAYLIAFKKSKFIHIDNHLDNFLIKKTNKDQITYELDNISIDTYGFQIIVMDFDKSIDNQYNKSSLSIYTYNENDFIIEFFRNIKNLFNNPFKYIDIISGTIITYIESIQNSMNVNNILQLLDLIDNLDYQMRR
jgi:hypothetical protein